MDHRHYLDEKIVENDDKFRTMQVGCGMVAFLLLIGLATLFAFMGMQYAAIAAIALPTMQGVAVLLHSMKSESTHLKR